MEPEGVGMAGHGVCPWWAGYFLASPLRRLLLDPNRLLSPYVHAGMTVLEPGPGMGFFTLELARLVGPTGRVVAVDIQPRMVEGLRRRARKARLLDRLNLRVGQPASMAVDDLHGTVAFAFAFAVVHEMPAPAPFFAEAARALKPGASLLLAEPAGHVDDAEFGVQLAAAAQAGLSVAARPPLRGYRAALLSKPAAAV
jgi:SAM-dependent methyltransferase